MSLEPNALTILVLFSLMTDQNTQNRLKCQRLCIYWMELITTVNKMVAPAWIDRHSLSSPLRLASWALMPRSSQSPSRVSSCPSSSSSPSSSASGGTCASGSTKLAGVTDDGREAGTTSGTMSSCPTPRRT